MRHARPAARLTVLVSPSGAGTQSVIELVRARSPLLWLPVRVTTRAPRGQERDGEHHHFVDRPAFERMIAAGELLEWASVAGHCYGTPRAPVLDRLRAGRPVLVRADPAGARQVRAVLPEARLALLVPPTGRGHAPPGLDRDPAERAPPGPKYDTGPKYGAGPKYDTVVVNDLAERAAGELVDFIGCPYLAPAQPGANG